MLLHLIQANPSAPNILTSPIPMLVIGCLLLLIGGVRYKGVARTDPSYRDNKSLAWLLVSLGAALLLAALLPLLINIEGTWQGITITAAGGAALFLVVYFGGWKVVSDAMDKDDVRIDLGGKNDGLTKETRRLTEELDKKVAEIIALRKSKDAIQPGDHYEYALVANESKRIIIATGRIQDLSNVDVWVNSENTNMYMARHTEHSVSATIRYLGAKWNGNKLVEDSVADELSKTMKERNVESVQPAEVIVTRAGQLEGPPHNVQRIFHVASVEGTPGYGFRPIQGVERCIGKALAEASSEGCRPLNLKSIVFPILGTGTGGGDVADVAPKLLTQAVNYLSQNETTIEKVYFLAFTAYQLKVCREALQTLPVRLVSQPAAAPAAAPAQV